MAGRAPEDADVFAAAREAKPAQKRALMKALVAQNVDRTRTANPAEEWEAVVRAARVVLQAAEASSHDETATAETDAAAEADPEKAHNALIVRLLKT